MTQTRRCLIAGLTMTRLICAACRLVQAMSMESAFTTRSSTPSIAALITMASQESQTRRAVRSEVQKYRRTTIAGPELRSPVCSARASGAPGSSAHDGADIFGR